MPDPADLSLRARLAEALRTAPSVVLDTPEERARHAESERNHHVTHNYYYGCAVCRGEVDTLAEAAAAMVQHELESLEQQAGNARWAARQSDQRATRAEFALTKWDDLRAEIHEQMRAGFADMIRSKWDSEASEPDADMAADACIDYLENEFAGQLARAATERDKAREQLAAVRAYADDLYTAPRRVNACGVRERLLDILTPAGPTMSIAEALAGSPATDTTSADPKEV